MEILTSDDYFGELSLLDGGPRIATIIASKEQVPPRLQQSGL